MSAKGICVNFDDVVFTDDGFYLYENRPFTGTGRQTDDSGNILGEIQFVDGLQHGPARDYYPTGRLMGETPYMEGLKHGVEREWTEDGKIMSEKVFEFDVLMKSKTWDESGRLMDEYSRPEADPLYCLVVERRNAEGRKPLPSNDSA